MLGATAGRMCSGSCVDLATDRNNCGYCGFQCPGGVDCTGGVCGTSCRAGFITCMGNCVDPQTDLQFCGASLDCAGANVGRRCSAVEHCVAGNCTYFEAPRSEVSPFAEAGDYDPLNVPRPITLSIGSILNGTIYYTLDGSDPRPGSPTTQTAFNTVSVTVGGAEGTTVPLRWYMDYGGFYGREPAIRQRLIRVLAGVGDGAGAIYENLRFNGAGPTALVAPLQRMTVELTVQQWIYRPGGFCAGCAILQWISADVTETSARALPSACERVPSLPYPGLEGDQRRYSFIAPERPGRYAIRVGQDLNFPTACPQSSRGGTPIAFFYVR